MSQSAPTETVVLRIAGMDCAEEVSLLRKGLANVPGIRDLKFDIMNSRLAVDFDPRATNLDVIHAAIHHIGMKSELWTLESRRCGSLLATEDFCGEIQVWHPARAECEHRIANVLPTIPQNSYFRQILQQRRRKCG